MRTHEHEIGFPNPPLPFNGFDGRFALCGGAFLCGDRAFLPAKPICIGSNQRRVRDPWRIGVTLAAFAQVCQLGPRRALHLRLPSKHKHGIASGPLRPLDPIRKAAIPGGFDLLGLVGWVNGFPFHLTV